MILNRSTLTPPRRLARVAAALALAAPAAPALAQLDILQPPPDLPGLADPPLLQHVLLENPVPGAIVAILAALLALWIAARAGRTRLGLLVAAVAMLLGVACVALAALVKTDREVVIARTGEVVAAVAEADAAALDQLLHPDARVFVRGSGSGFDRSWVLGLVRTVLTRPSPYAVEEHRLSDVQAEIGPGGVTARSRATVVVDSSQWSPTPVICMLTWRRDPDVPGPRGWTVNQIEPLWVQGLGIPDARDMPRWR